MESSGKSTHCEDTDDDYLTAEENDQTQYYSIAEISYTEEVNVNTSFLKENIEKKFSSAVKTNGCATPNVNGLNNSLRNSSTNNHIPNSNTEKSSLLSFAKEDKRVESQLLHSEGLSEEQPFNIRKNELECRPTIPPSQSPLTAQTDNAQDHDTIAKEENDKIDTRDPEIERDKETQPTKTPRRKPGRKPKEKSVAKVTHLNKENESFRRCIPRKKPGRPFTKPLKKKTLPNPYVNLSMMNAYEEYVTSSAKFDITTNACDIVENAFECKKCPERFKTKYLLVKHEESHNVVPEETVNNQRFRFACGVCAKRFSTEILLNAHKKLHVKQRLLQNTCTYKITPKKISTAKKIELRCDRCGKLCASTALLDKHKKMHETISCVKCKQTFVSKLLLNYHLRNSCVKVAQKKSLFHKADKATDNGPLLLTCPVCKDARFETHTELYRHRRTVHERLIASVANETTVSGKFSSVKAKKDAIAHKGVPLLLKHPTK